MITSLVDNIQSYGMTFRLFPELLELARSPLLLSMMALVSEEEPLKSKHGFGPTHEGRRYLFNKYIELMLARVSKDQQYARDRTLYWLRMVGKGPSLTHSDRVLTLKRYSRHGSNPQPRS